jgi:DNA-binding NtrC family response regulator
MLMDLLTKLRSMHLLLIDDDEWVRDSLRMFFEGEGCDIVALETAEEGLDITSICHFDIIITDYRLPGIDGLEFIKHLPANQADALKVLITAYGSEDLLSKARQLGFHELISKPFTTQIIEASLERLINQRNL